MLRVYIPYQVDGLIRLMEGDNTGPINIGNPNEFTMLELAETVKQVVSPGATYKTVPNTPDDPKQRKPDITKAKTLLGWEPKVQIISVAYPSIVSVAYSSTKVFQYQSCLC